MTTSSNGTSTMGRTFFRYFRPAVNGFGISDEPDPEVATVLDELVALLQKGFVDKGNEDDDRLRSLRYRLKVLEDESRNGTSDANETLKNKINEVKIATQIVLRIESQANKASREVSDAKNLLDRLLTKQANQNERETVPEDQADNEDKKKKEGNENKTGVKSAVKTDNLKAQIKAAKDDLFQKQHQQKDIENKLLTARNDLIGQQSTEQQAAVTLGEISEKVKADTKELIRAIRKFEEEGSDFDYYGKALKLENLPGKNGELKKFKSKIGSDPALNSPFLLVEDKLQKSNLPFNTALFMKHPVIVEYIFLRTYLIDGLRDANAIFERMTDEKEGGVKYLYDYIVKKVVIKMIKAKKLNDE